MSNRFAEPDKPSLIYVYKVEDDYHDGLLKIGLTTVSADEDDIPDLTPNCERLNEAAKKRIKDQTNTAAVKAKLVYTEIAVKEDGSREFFSDAEVHKVLRSHNIDNRKFSYSTAKEWFETDLDTVIRAIKAVKSGEVNLSGLPSGSREEIIFRAEQEEAIDKTIGHFREGGKKMLWNAKMRFGKTLSALEVVRRSGFKNTIIVTHRPVVDDVWYEEFGKIFHNTDEKYRYASKSKGGGAISDLTKDVGGVVYFASLQDLRGSQDVGGSHAKNDDILSTEWDLVILDEAHEGTKTELGELVIEKLVNSCEKTKLLSLSGTPFNIADEYDENSTFTWDYISEQEAKECWDKKFLGVPNPYRDLPKMNMFTYSLKDMMSDRRYTDDDSVSFSFKEFFRTKGATVSKTTNLWGDSIECNEDVFVHEEDVKRLLDMLTDSSEKTDYPFSTEEYRNMFKHTLWMVPGVKEAKALSKMLRSHAVFGSDSFKVVNVAGEGDEEEKPEKALKKVKSAIKTAGEKGYTITLSCGRLTTGVTIPEWTAVLYLAGSNSTSAANYLQTIFRVQSPCNRYGKLKQNCYVFDFAPDRTLRMVAGSISMSTRPGATRQEDRLRLREFLNYCPVISIKGSGMDRYDAAGLIGKLKMDYAENVIANGFEDDSLYSETLLNISDSDLERFNALGNLVGSSKKVKRVRPGKNIVVNDHGFSERFYGVGEDDLKVRSDTEKTVPVEGIVDFSINYVNSEPEYSEDKNSKTPERRDADEEVLESGIEGSNISITADKEESEEVRRREVRRLARDKKKQAETARSILRSISIRLPLMIYASDVDFENVSMSKLTDIIDDISWEEFMPRGVTKSVFRNFTKYYDPDIFAIAAKRIHQSVKEADNLPVEKRISKIAEMFGTFKNPDKETVLTPWHVVNRHLGDCIGGYNFYNEDFSEKVSEPRYIDNGRVSYNTVDNRGAKILEVNAKSGLYALYAAYSIFRSSCKGYREESLTENRRIEIWKEVIRENIFLLCRNEMSERITKRTLVGFMDIPINSVVVNDLNDIANESPQDFADLFSDAEVWNRSGDKMSFSAIIGHPPGSEVKKLGEGKRDYYLPSYVGFVQGVILMRPFYASLITPSKWMSGNGRGGAFVKMRSFMRKEGRISKLFLFEDGVGLFKTPGVSGGVSYFLYENDHTEDVEFNIIDSNMKKSVSTRKLFENGLDVVLTSELDCSIIGKIINISEGKTILPIVSGVNPFGFVGKESELKRLTSSEHFEGAATLFVRRGEVRYVAPEKVKKNADVFNGYKVLIPKISPALTDKHKKVLYPPRYSSPMEGCTDFMIYVGGFDNALEASNLKKYIETKFLRFLVGASKNSMQSSRFVYALVPMQDFTDNSDIYWSASVRDVDRQLYKKYGLNEDEIRHIEDRIDYLR